MTQYRRPGAEQLEHIEAAARENPGDPTVWEWYAFTLYGLEKYADSVEAYRKSIELRPENPSSHYYLGNSLHFLENIGEAVKAWEEVVRLAPKRREGVRAREKIKQYKPEFEVVPISEEIEDDGSGQGMSDFMEVGDLVQKEKMEALAVMAQGICHELNNPLMVITGFADLLTRILAEEEPKLRAMPEKIKEAGRRCVDVIRRFSNFANRVGIRHTREVEISQLIHEVLSILGASFKGRGIQVVTKLEIGLIIADADPSDLQLALMSLMSNSREAMPQGGFLEVSVHGVDGKIHIEIRDNGVGMNEKDLAHLFEPFYTRKRNWQSLGLGLAEAYVTIRQNRGSISCESVVDKGTTFHIELPLARKQKDAVKPSLLRSPLVTPKPPELAGRSTSRNNSVLLIDTDYDFMYLVGRYIEKRGYKVTQTSDVDAALAGLQHGQYRMVLIDPLVSGPLLIEKLRQLRKSDPDIPVLLMLGMASQIDADFAEELGSTQWIQKPFSLDELMRLFDVLMGDSTPAHAGD